MKDFGFIHEFIAGATSQTLLLLHGTGANEQSLLPLGRVLDPSANLLSPRGKVLEEGRVRFFRRFAEGVFDLKDLEFRTNELNDFVAAAAEHYDLAVEEMILVGYSNGATIASSLLLCFPGRFRRAILFRAMAPFLPESSPDLSATSVAISAGRNDRIIPFVETEWLADLLRNGGAEVALEIVESDHGLTKDDLRIAQDWLARQA
ncbi:MAG TPA: alpha/beta hydrolase [Chthoniobacterales bacterium]|jgi:predicted esterase